MPKKKAKDAPKKTARRESGSWKSIPQKAGRSKASPKLSVWRRLAMTLRFAGIVGGVALMIGCLGLGGYFLYSRASNPVEQYDGERQVQLVINTNGVLPKHWIDYRLELEPQLGLMQLDLAELRMRLESYPQVRKADVERVFPNTLKVTVEERYPVLRMKVKDASGNPHLLLVDSEGHVFENVRFPRHIITELPYLAGVELRQGEGGYQRLDCMQPLVDLIRVARSEYPAIYRDWAVIHANQLIMARSFVEGYIRIQTSDIEEILFAPENYARQLENLEYILDNQEGDSVRSISRVNLSLINQPTVEFARNTRRHR